MPKALSVESRESLEKIAKRVGLQKGRQKQYKLATSSFSAKSPKATFAEIKANLSEVSPNVEACYYCERDRHRDIDHIVPKSLHPELAFIWESFAFSCAICNQDCKRSAYSVISPQGNLVNCSGIIGTEDDMPDGEPAFIDPRRESGLDFFYLDLETGLFVVRDDISQVEKIRAEFTKSTLDLNDDGLARIRKQAYRGFVRYVTALASALDSGDQDLTSLLIDEVNDLGHPTVMVEAWRQRKKIGIFCDKLEQVYNFIDLNKWQGGEENANLL